MAAFLLQSQSWVAAIEATWPAKLEVFTIWPFTEKVDQSLLYYRLSSSLLLKPLQWLPMFLEKSLKLLKGLTKLFLIDSWHTNKSPLPRHSHLTFSSFTSRVTLPFFSRDNSPTPISTHGQVSSSFDYFSQALNTNLCSSWTATASSGATDWVQIPALSLNNGSQASHLIFLYLSCLICKIAIFTVPTHRA